MSIDNYKDACDYILHVRRETLRQDLFTYVYDIIKHDKIEELHTTFTEPIISNKFIYMTLKRIKSHGIDNMHGMTNRIVSMIFKNIHKILPSNVQEYMSLPHKLQKIVREYIGLNSDSHETINSYLHTYFTKDYKTLLSFLKGKETRYNPHQIRVRDFFLRYKPRYGILYHEMGSGKTCTATALIGAISTLDDIRTIYIIVPNAYLVKQFAEDFEYICSFTYGEVWEKIVKNSMTIFTYKHQTYYIMTYVSYGKYKDVKPNSVLLIDEAHNLRSATDITKIEGDSPEVQLRQSIFSKIITNDMTFRHVFYMTGTPVMNIPNDFIQLLNAMLVLTCQSKSMLTRFNNEEYKDLMKSVKPETFFESIPTLLKLIDTTLRSTRGFVSRVRVQDLSSTLRLPSIDFTNHYYDYSSDFTGAIQGQIPYDIYEKYKTGVKASPIKIHMSQENYTSLMEMRTQDIDIKSDKLSWGTKDKHIHLARVICNKDKIPIIISNVKRHFSSSQKSPVLIHTLLMETVEDIQQYLENEGFCEFEKENANCDFKYAIISGKTPDKKVDTIMAAYNNVANIKGDIISVCIITSAAGTGFTFRNTRQLHIVEPYFNFSYLQQVTGRAVRHNVFGEYISDIDGTIKLPHVKIFAYIATHPRLLTNASSHATIDEEILKMMHDKMRYVETYSSLLYKLSIEYPRSELNAANFYAYPVDTETYVCTKEIKLLKSIKKVKKNLNTSSNASNTAQVEKETITKKTKKTTTRTLFVSPKPRYLKPVQVEQPPIQNINKDENITRNQVRKRQKRVVEQSDRVLRTRIPKSYSVN